MGEALYATAIEVVSVHAAVILGAGSTSCELVRYHAERLPVVPMPTWMRSPVAPMTIDDVLRYLRAALDPARLPAGHHDMSNGETLTYADLIEAYAASRHRRR